MLIRGACITASLVAHGAIMLSVSGTLQQSQQPAATRALQLQVTHIPAAPAKSLVSAVVQPAPITVQPEPIVAPPEPIATPDFLATKKIPLREDDPVVVQKVTAMVVRSLSPSRPKPSRKPPNPIAGKMRVKAAVENAVAEESPPLQPVLAPSPAEIKSRPVELVATASRKAVRRERSIDTEKTESLLDRFADLELAYKKELLHLIEAHKKYPIRSRRKGHEGVVLVSFVIRKDGSITLVSTSAPSNYVQLDRAATRLVERIGQFKPIPLELQKERWAFEVPIRYALK